ncbi:MAG: PhoH family protein [Gammaproteobacteria bacterium]|nr:PhoH family protein [Gammaproteobacteria bacterium]|tara:strand:- start:277471 stop:278523 length:1053 start_codon:yes stop_codon:yes gene_type:complete
MTSDNQAYRLSLEPENPHRLANLSGRLNEHIQQIEQRLHIKIQSRGNLFTLIGDAAAVSIASQILEGLYKLTENREPLSPSQVHLIIQEHMHDDVVEEPESVDEEAPEQSVQFLRTPKLSIKPRSNHQNEYVRAIMRNDINFGIGPAGTGKTYLAVACAVEALVNDRVNRILLVRPAVEAGEKLGFLPGDLAQKVDPYLRPLYDALYEMLGFERVAKLIERNVIEVAPLAYMRGRTLNNSFIILDESQNTTSSQMKMFLTRIGFGSTAIITGDITQIDLPKGERSGLVHVSSILQGTEGVSFSYFTARDVVRHPIVQRVVEAYEAHDRKNISSLPKSDNPEQERRHERDN